jgi:hypothetical protein
MTNISAAMSEITRVAWWSLRALGCPIGAVERMAKVLAISEVLEGGCLEALRHDEGKLIESFNADEPQFVRKNVQYGIVDASGRTFLDIGPRTVDLLTGIAKTSGAIRIRVRNASDLLGLSGACVLAAHRGIPVLSIAMDDRTSSQLRWTLYVNTPSGIQTISGTTGDGQSAILATLGSAGIASESLTVLLPGGERDEIGDEPFALDLIGFAPRETCEFGADLASRANAELHWTDVSAALHDAFANGISVEASNLKFLYELETRTWAPSSERSRMQAGFGVPSPAS